VGGVAGNRPEQPFGITGEMSELLAKAVFGTVVVGDGSDFPNRIIDSPFDGE
jgi:hypothetical protein